MVEMLQLFEDNPTCGPSATARTSRARGITKHSDSVIVTPLVSLITSADDEGTTCRPAVFRAVGAIRRQGMRVAPSGWRRGLIIVTVGVAMALAAGARADESTQQRINFLRTQIHILNKDLEPLRGERDDLALVLKRANEYRASIKDPGQLDPTCRNRGPFDSMWEKVRGLDTCRNELKAMPPAWLSANEISKRYYELDREYAALYERYRAAMTGLIRRDDHMKLMAIFDFDELVASYGLDKPKRVRLDQLTKRITTLEAQVQQHEDAIKRLQ